MRLAWPTRRLSDGGTIRVDNLPNWTVTIEAVAIWLSSELAILSRE
jgi:hypothetical protein